jgi:hypothetical protein
MQIAEMTMVKLCIIILKREIFKLEGNFNSLAEEKYKNKKITFFVSEQYTE